MKNYWSSLICFLFLLLCVFNTAFAQASFQTLTTEGMKELYDKRKVGTADFILVNTLDEIVYRASSIPGSVNIPWTKVNDFQDKLGKIKNKLIITYCEDAGGVSAYKTAVAIKKLGYENIKIYKGGLEEWDKAGHKLKSTESLPEYEVQYVTAEELLKDLRKADSKRCVDWKNKPLITILDLRTANFLEQKFPVFHIKTECQTIKMLSDQLSESSERDKIPKNGRVVTVTEKGKRDPSVIRYLYKHGYTNVVALNSGIQSWIRLKFSLKSKK